MGICKEVIQFNLNGEEVRKFKSANEAAIFFGVNKSFICRRIKNEKEYKGFLFKYSGNDNRINHDHPELEFKCPYCDRHFATYNGLCKHVIKEKAHGNISKEQLLTDYKYNGVRPTCACGCGGYTNITYIDGGAHFTKYITGHHLRVHNNWGHNKKAQEKSAETRRRQYASGERVQWNKGKTWDETYTKEQQDKLMKVIMSEERRRKIQMQLIGKEKSPEHKAFIKRMGQEQWFKDLQRSKMVKRLTEGTFSVSSGIELEFIEKCINPLGIDYKTQYYIKDLTHFSDVFFPEKNIIVEFNGDFWHCNPKKYPNGPIHKIQERKVEKDRELREYCDLHNIMLIEIWESDYKKDIEGVKNLLRNILLD